jgi:hypothetical protein
MSNMAARNRGMTLLPVPSFSATGPECSIDFKPWKDLPENAVDLPGTIAMIQFL